jgi:hypothetical protein
MMMLLSWSSFHNLVLPQKGHLRTSDVVETDFLVVQVRKTGSALTSLSAAFYNTSYPSVLLKFVTTAFSAPVGGSG